VKIFLKPFILMPLGRERALQYRVILRLPLEEQ
jgi:hypothetical protein